MLIFSSFLGRTNVNQTTDITVPTPAGGEREGDENGSAAVVTAPRLLLTVKGPNLPGVQDVEVSGIIISGGKNNIECFIQI